jgi:KipI family sensor histidine kinase inhibitor
MNVHHMGDSALLVETHDSAEAQRLRHALDAEHIPGLRQLVPGYNSLLLAADPLLVELDALARRLPELLQVPSQVLITRSHEIPVRYAGEDLEAVAAALDVSTAEVVRRHSAASYIVAFLGFAPGFAYLTGLDPTLQLPRLATPRTRTPEGAVAVAGEFTGIYPQAMPGGWRVLGIATTRLFDAARASPALLAPGDQVRFKVIP